ncbi:unnamed protein product [Adineta steineri]|uniref:NAD(P)(+)--arginine ADP-ribosyltransferase n=1 Tax=Adineta steineri TaxID=433720 RepID=A0A820A525_9BILA|nr:unnamed protein product [Adineta steineri]
MSSDAPSSSTQNQRFIDIESNILLRAISGYQNEPLVTLEKAIAPIKHLLGEDIETDIYLAKMKSKRPKDGLTQDESGAVQLLTMDSSSYKESLYFILNQTLRSKNRQLLKIWYSYLQLLLSGLWKLPNEKKIIWHGAKGNLSDQFDIDDDIIWWGFNSCLESLNVLENEEFLGKTGARTLFKIESCNGKVIRNHSFFEVESEVLLLPGTQLVVVGKEIHEPDTYIIHLKEIEKPAVQLLKPPFPQGNEAQQQATIRMEEEEEEHITTTEVVELEVIEPEIYSNVQELVKQLKANTADSTLQLNRFKNLSTDDAKAIADGLKTNTSVTYLYCGHPKDLSRESMRYILEGLKVNRTIDQLNLTGSGIPNCCDLIAETLKVNVSLTTLWLEGDVIKTNDDVKVLAEALKRNMRLEILVLRNTRIEDEGAIFLSEMLGMNYALKQLVIDCGKTDTNNCYQTHSDYNRITDRTAKAIATAVSRNGSLTHLYLESSEIGDEGAVAFSEMLKINRKLMILSLSKNKITDKGATVLANALGHSSGLRYLSVDGNLITQTGYSVLELAAQNSLPRISIDFYSQ